MKKTKTLFEQLKDRANQLSAGEAIIVLDEINKKEGFENAVIFLNSRMKKTEREEDGFSVLFSLVVHSLHYLASFHQRFEFSLW